LFSDEIRYFANQLDVVVSWFDSSSINKAFKAQAICNREKNRYLVHGDTLLKRCTFGNVETSATLADTGSLSDAGYTSCKFAIENIAQSLSSISVSNFDTVWYA
jgi:hypothetical protein